MVNSGKVEVAWGMSRFANQYRPSTPTTISTSTKTASFLALKTRAAKRHVPDTALNFSSIFNRTNTTYSISGPTSTSHASPQTSPGYLRSVLIQLLYIIIPVAIFLSICCTWFTVRDAAARRRNEVQTRERTRDQESRSLYPSTQAQRQLRYWIGDLNASRPVLGHPQQAHQAGTIAIESNDSIGPITDQNSESLRLPPPAVMARPESVYMSTNPGWRTPPPAYRVR